MSILLECYNVIVPKAAVADRYSGGLSRYRVDCPNGTYTEDEFLARVSFMSLRDVEFFIDTISASGLVGTNAGSKAADIAVVDTVDGPTQECDWLEWTREGVGARCWLRGSPEGELCRTAPPDWDALMVELGINEAPAG